LAILTGAAGLLIPGAFVALTPSAAGAQGADPLGPTIIQVEAGVQLVVFDVENDVFGPFGVVFETECVVYGLDGRPCV
jgi:hypothetical protein